jgi:hypothetical protein
MLVVVVHSFKRYSFEVFCFGFIRVAFPLRCECYACYCPVIKDVEVVLSVSLCMPVGSSHCLCSCVVNRSVYVDIKCM